MIENQEVYQKITRILQNKGPSLPMQIAKEVGMSSLFISAFLSEMLQERRVKMSHLKVGGTRLYLLPNQDELLENFYTFMNPKEIDAFLLLKERKIIKDSEQDPAMKFALRSISDFAKSFNFENELYWRYITKSEQTAREELQNQNKPKEKPVEIIKPIEKIEEPKKEVIIEEKIQITEIKEERPIQEKREEKTKIWETPRPTDPEKPVQKTPAIFKNPLAKEVVVEEKERPEFVQKIINFLERNNYKLIQEKESKKREFLGIIQVQTEFGPMNFLASAKDKKSIPESDVKTLLETAQSIPLPALILYTDAISRNAQKYIDNYFSILKSKKID